MRRSFACAVGWMVGAAVFGYTISLIPSPAQPGVFWISNLSSPWLAIAFLAGLSQRSAFSAGIAGALTDIACVVGFYLHFLFLSNEPLARGASQPFFSRISGNLSHWLLFTGPWIFFAIVAGATFGVLGFLWWRRDSSLSGAALGIAFLFEPVAWYAHYGRFEPPFSIWFGEMLFGLIAAAVMWWALKRRRSTSVSHLIR